MSFETAKMIFKMQQAVHKLMLREISYVFSCHITIHTCYMTVHTYYSTIHMYVCSYYISIHTVCVLVVHNYTRLLLKYTHGIGVLITCLYTRGGGLGSRPKKMYGERLRDGVEYHLMSPTPRC